LDQQLVLVNSTLTALQNNYADLLTSYNNLQLTVVKLNSSLTSVIQYLSLNTDFENLNITSMYSNFVGGHTWDIVCVISNNGYINTTITDLYVNAKSISLYGGNIVVFNASNPSLKFLPPSLIVPRGITNLAITIELTADQITGDFIHGQVVDIKLHTEFGKDYPKSVVLP
jgi:hypothetical protein